MEAIVLAAGRGTRLGRDIPKPLTVLGDGRTILQQQLDNLAAVFGSDLNLQLVVGHGVEHFVAAHPEIAKVYNEDYERTNTSKSLLRALHNTPHSEGVLWLNGDLVFDQDVLRLGESHIGLGESFVTVNQARVSDEEVKYTVDSLGYVLDLSKTVPLEDALGEAVGINYVSPADKGELLYWLNKSDSHDYFERAIELTVKHSDARFRPVNVGARYAVEVDFESDLIAANLAAANS